MTWLFIGLVVLVVAAVAAVAVGRGEGLAVAQPDRPEVSVPADRLLTGSDLDQVGLSVGLRGYRMDEVDDLLTRLGSEIDERDRRLADLLPPPTPLEAPRTPDASTSPDRTAPEESTVDGRPAPAQAGPPADARVPVAGSGEAR